MTKVILAEKPSVAKKIALFLGDSKPRSVQYKRGRDTAYYYITTIGGEPAYVVPAAGHLYALDTDELGYDYPVFKVRWKAKYEVTDAKGNPIKAYSYTRAYEEMIRCAVAEAIKGSCKTPPSPESLRKMIMASDVEIIVATDFDREGETIAYTILRYSLGLTDDDIRQKVKRMKFSAITPADIRKAYNNPIGFQFNYAMAGIARHKVDWIWGINLSRGLTNSTKKVGKFAALSTGRVQGPTLKLIVDREKEIERFVPKPYWFIKAIVNRNGIEFEARHATDKFWDKEKALKVLEKVKNSPLKVENINTRIVKKNPPAPFDLTTLQKEAYRVYKYSPKKTLDIAQKLYEKGYLTYPRTDSQKLPRKNWREVLEKLTARTDVEMVIKEALAQEELRPVEGKKDDPAHKAIHPTGIVPEGLDTDEENIYTLVLRRFIAAFMPPAKIRITTVVLDANGEKFRAQGKEIHDLGYLKSYKYDTPEDVTILPPLEEGEVLDSVKYKLVEEKTKPPSRYSMSKLIETMEKLGLGTKATRGDIIDTLFKRGYITGRTSIRPLPLGRAVVETLESYAPEIVSVELTANLEKELSDVQDGKLSADKIVDDVIEKIKPILNNIKQNEDKIGSNLSNYVGKNNNGKTKNKKGGSYYGQNKRYKKSGKRTYYSKRK